MSKPNYQIMNKNKIN